MGVGCPNWDQMVQLLQIRKDSVHQAPAAREVRVVQEEKLDIVVTARAHSEAKVVSFFTDHRVTPQFGDFDFEKLEQEINGTEANQIKLNLWELSDEINKIIKSAWEDQERQKVNKYRTTCYPFLTISYC